MLSCVSEGFGATWKLSRLPYVCMCSPHCDVFHDFQNTGDNQRRGHTRYFYMASLCTSNNSNCLCPARQLACLLWDGRCMKTCPRTVFPLFYSRNRFLLQIQTWNRAEIFSHWPPLSASQRLYHMTSNEARFLKVSHITSLQSSFWEGASKPHSSRQRFTATSSKAAEPISTFAGSPWVLPASPMIRASKLAFHVFNLVLYSVCNLNLDKISWYWQPFSNLVMG